MSTRDGSNTRSTVVNSSCTNPAFVGACPFAFGSVDDHLDLAIHKMIQKVGPSLMEFVDQFYMDPKFAKYIVSG